MFFVSQIIPKLREWQKQDEADKDSATMKLITAISKPCPKCGISVDRTDGCINKHIFSFCVKIIRQSYNMQTMFA